ncbi:MAG: lipopolysaccharide assembly protein LapA domain-containing protein [Gammaproteobacteria bacterium]|nr:lipopolysaccharide assembly protein LapA domain-containing protein [Gammaproteobacteria bacterium]
MTWLRRAVAVLLALVLFLVAVVAVNQDQISLRFLAWQTPALSVFWWLLISLLLGLLLGLAAAAGVIARRSLRNRRLSRRLQSANEELQRLQEQTPAAPAGD